MMNFSMMSYSLARQRFNPYEIIAATSELGLEWIDWVSTYGESPRTLRKCCAAAGVKIAAYTFFLPDFQAQKSGWRDQLAKEMATAAELGAPLCMLGTPGLEYAADRNEGQKLWLEAVAAFVDAALAYDMVPTVENYPGITSPMITSSDYAFFSGTLPELMLTFDPGNAMTGEAPLDCLRKCADRVVHVHFKDWTVSHGPKPGATQMLDGRFYTPALVGEGDVAIAQVLHELDYLGYKGCINIEYESDDIPAIPAMRRALQYLHRIEADDATIEPPAVTVNF